jgi:putative peptide zinc metalloprotease protein
MLKLRKNLQVTPPGAPGEDVKITDPNTGKVFMIGPSEVRLLRLIAKQPIHEVAQTLKITTEEVKAFIDSLQMNNLLEKVEASSNGNTQRSNNVVQLKPTKLKLNEAVQSQAPKESQGPAIRLKREVELTETDNKLLIEEKTNNRFFSLGNEEANLLKQLLHKPFPQVLAESSFSETEINNFVQNLASKGLLSSSANEQTQLSTFAPPAKPLLSLLVQRFKLVNPDRFLGFVDQTFGWLWKGPAMGIHVGILLFSLFLAFDQHAVLQTYGFPRLFGNIFLNALLFLGIISLILTGHEIAHGLSLKSFGGEVPEMGVFLLYGFPSAYTNVSGAYKLPRKTQKMWVILAGVLFQLWIGSMALIAWSFSQPHTWFSDLNYLVCVASFLNLAINLNPLVKLDGYYLLTLLLDKPNLRQKSFKLLFGDFKQANSFGEGVLFFCFGLLSIIYTFGLLSFLFVSLFKVGLENAPFLAGFVVLLLFWASKASLPSLNPINITDQKPLISSTEFQPSLPNQQSNKIKTNEFNQNNLRNAPFASNQKSEKKFFNFVPLVILLTIGSLLFVEIPYQVGGEVEVSPSEKQRSLIRSPIQGVVEKVYVKSGDYVKAGQKLLSIIDWGLMEQLTQTAGKNPLEDTESPRLARLTSQVEQSKLQTQKLQLELQKAQLTYKNNLRKAISYAKLAREGAFPKNTAEEAAYNAEVAKQEIQKIKKDLELNKEVQNSAKSDFQSLRGQIQFYEQKSRLQNITSPISGYVLTEDVDLQKGAMTSPQETLLSIADLRKVQVKIKVVQEDLPTVKTGQKVKLSIRAYPEQTFYGYVSEIALVSEDPKRADPSVVRDMSRKRWNVTMLIDNNSLLLKPGMSGYAYIDSSSRKKVWQFLFREIYRVFSLERFIVFKDSMQKAGI